MLDLGLVVGAAGAGNFVGTAIGTRLAMIKPELVIIACTAIAGAVCVLVAIVFNPPLAAFGMLVAAAANALGKIALDALIQRDVLETLRSSAFARSETFLQLAWVLGAAAGVLLPSRGTTDGTVAFVIGAVVTVLVAAVIFLRNRVLVAGAGPDASGAGSQTNAAATPEYPLHQPGAGSFMPRSSD